MSVGGQPRRCFESGMVEQLHDLLAMPFETETSSDIWLHSEYWRNWYQNRKVEVGAALVAMVNQGKKQSLMTKRKATQGKKTKIVVANDPEDRKGTLKSIGGSQSDHWNNTLANQAAQVLWLKHSDSEECDRQLAATVAALIGIAPKDELESMMAAQLIAAHNAAMECYRRAMFAEQTFEGAARESQSSEQALPNLGSIARCPEQASGKGQQKVTVEHVHVHRGGQAVVGTIERPRGGGARRI